MRDERHVGSRERRLGARNELVEDRWTTRALSQAGLTHEAVSDQLRQMAAYRIVCHVQLRGDVVRA